MILVKLRLENYKQYAGEHRIEFPAQGVVAVIGANGVGKTTLFEAIEWCLYNPREIENGEVPPRGGVGQTRVGVVLEDPRDGVRYVVERGLKRGVTTAEVFREDQPESPIVQGTRQVTDYVARRLIGLGHRAFVSTFFTRQKELSFFGSLKETDRRREVGRLLGLETIRHAQQLIAEERQLARTEAAALAMQYQRQSAGRDLPVEIAAAETVIADQTAAATAATVAQQQAAASHDAARRELARWHELERADEAHRRELARLAGEERAATAKREAEAAALRHLDEAARTRERLLPQWAAEAANRAAVAAQVVDRERWERQRHLEADLARAEASGRDIAADIRQTVRGAGAESGNLPGWGWSDADDAEPATATIRLLAATVHLDATSATERAQQLETCRGRIEVRDAAAKTLAKYHRRLAEIETERTLILGAGDPNVAAADARRAREQAVERAGSARAAATAAAGQRTKLERIAEGIRTAAQGEVCPTCQRHFKPEEVEVSLSALEDGVNAERLREASFEEERRAAERAAAVAETKLLAAQERVQELGTLDGRIAQGTPMVEEAETRFRSDAEECDRLIQELGLGHEPSREEVAAAAAHATLLQRVEHARASLRRLSERLRQATDEGEAALTAIAALGPVSYDPAAHAAAERELEAAVAAAARIAEIDGQLQRRPDHEAARAGAAAEIAQASKERDRVEAVRAALGFDAAARAAAADAEQQTLADMQVAGAALNAAQEAAREAIRHHDELLRDQRRLAELVAQAEARARDADELQRMYGEFGRFDQYVANKVTPQLADLTGSLLAAVTEGKYDRVEFDDNYGLKLYDDDECFAIEEFSGGERDVAALSARLALSQMIGAQAARPPRFLVLDEVFGSLDQDRRAQVLATLGALAPRHERADGLGDDGGEAFRQLFIISHVDDIRLSAVVDEVWRISEIDGVSRWENVTRLGSVEDF